MKFMKKIISFCVGLFLLLGCEKKDCCTNLEPITVTLQFTHNWDGIPINSSDFTTFKFTTEHGELISIEQLRYLVSRIKIGNFEKNYQLINVGESTGLELVLPQIPQGNQFLKFTFGFTDADNIDGIYPDLNSRSFNVPMMMGGGYHFMQFDGKYKDSNNQNANFNYHAIRAVNTSNPMNLILEDTSFEVEIGTFELSKNTTIEIKMNVAEWFKNPNLWDLNVLNTVLMPNFDAQKMMSENGRNVFSVGTISN
jgi:hypothetical protein